MYQQRTYTLGPSKKERGCLLLPSREQAPYYGDLFLAVLLTRSGSESKQPRSFLLGMAVRTKQLTREREEQSY